MARSKYSRGLKIKVAKEAMLPENQGLEHVIAEKYHVMPWTVIKWQRPSSAGRGRKCIQEGIHSKKTFHSKRGRTGKRKCTAAGGSRDPKKSSGLPRKCKARLKYLFMREHRQEHTIARMAKVLGVSESGYFKWCKKNNAPLTEKEQEDIKITEEIFAIYRSSRGSYGSRKITAILNKMHKKPINHKRVERIMRNAACFQSPVKNISA